MKLRRRQKLWLLFLVGVGLAGGYLYFDLRDFLGLNSMSLNTASKAWGVKKFSPDRFRNGSKEERASQVVSLVRSNSYTGKQLTTVKAELGEHDGYYNSDEIPAYILPEFNGSSWSLIFVPNQQGKVHEVVIHKECCYRGVLNMFLK